MGSMSLFHWLLVGAVVLILFGGKGKISDLMGDVAKGIKSFKKGLSEDDAAAPPATPAAQPGALEHKAPASASADTTRDSHKAG
jgi:sec-independent protein translocase protein TatA